MSSAGPYRDQVVVNRVTKTPSNFGSAETRENVGAYAAHVGPPSVSVDTSTDGQVTTITRVVRFRFEPPISFTDCELVWDGRTLKPILPASTGGSYRNRGRSFEITCTDVTDKRGP